jgi:hypothetical protein
MQSTLRDVLLSFCPASFRRERRPESSVRVVSAAKWTGLLQFFFLAYFLIVRYWHFLLARTKLWSHVRGTEAFESGVLIIATLEFFLYPLSLVVFYFCLEGFARFVTGLISADVVPSLPVFLFVKTKSALSRKREDARVRRLPPDSVTQLADDRLRIATALERPAWLNPSLTISVGETFYELERMDKGALPHPFIYYLRCAPVGKILRGIEEYTPPVAPQKDVLQESVQQKDAPQKN